MATKIKIKRTRGDTARLVFTVKDSKGVAVNISAWTAFTMTVDTAEYPVDNANNVSQMNGVLIGGGTEGRVYFVVDGTIPVGDYFFDIQAIDANSEKITIAKGGWIVEQDITKS